MKCDRSTRLDLAAFLAGETNPEVEEFRAHYPSCPDCTAKVRAWMELHTELDPPPADRQHPSEELLLRFESQPEEMSAVARSSVETHLKTCASCRDELKTLRQFDFSILQQPAADAAKAASQEKPAGRSWLRDFFAPVRRIVLHPAFAYGLVLLLLLPELSVLLPSRHAFSPPQVSPLVGEPSAESELAPAAAPPERKRRQKLVDELADKPQRLHGGAEGVVALHEKDERAFGRPDAEVRERAAAAQPPSLEKQKRERDSLAAWQAPEANVAKTDQAEEAAPSAEGRFMQRSLSKDAAGEPKRVVTIQMDPSGRNNIPMQGMLGGATLHIKPQQPVTPGSDVAIRIKSADGRRELREIHTASGNDGYLDMTVPPGWMADGTYSVEVWPLDALPKNPSHHHDAPHQAPPNP